LPHDPDNLAVAVTRIGKAKFKEAMIDDPAGRFKGKTIQVQGVVTVKDDRPRIDVDDPQQIETVR
jgi:hypothetical protein